MDTSLTNIQIQLDKMNDIIINKLETIETRLARLEKVDSIEHRVSVNQIDLTDIKEALERIEENHIFKTNPAIDHHNKASDGDVLSLLKRLDSQLLRIAKLEEEIALLKEN